MLVCGEKHIFCKGRDRAESEMVSEQLQLSSETTVLENWLREVQGVWQ